MSMPWDDLEGPAKLLAICAAVFLVSAGLCGVQWFVIGFADGRGGGQALAGIVILLGVVELIAMAGSIVVGFVALILWIAGFKGSQRGPDPGAQTLFPRDKDEKDDEEQP